MSPNVNPETGIRMGVISVNSLDDWIANEEIFYGPDTVDLDYEAYMEEAEAQARADYEGIYEEALEEANAKHLDDIDKDGYIDDAFAALGYPADRDEFVEMKREMASEMYEADEPTLEGELDGVKWHLSWLGGAPLLWVTEGPTGIARQLCSPCVPNAADLDGGFVLESESVDGVDWDAIDTKKFNLDEGYFCYCVPRDWLRKKES